MNQRLRQRRRQQPTQWRSCGRKSYRRRIVRKLSKRWRKKNNRNLWLINQGVGRKSITIKLPQPLPPLLKEGETRGSTSQRSLWRRIHLLLLKVRRKRMKTKKMTKVVNPRERKG